MPTATRKTKRKQVDTKSDAPLVWPKEGLARIHEASLFLRCSRSSVYSLIRNELLETVPIGRDKRIKWPSLWRFAETGDGRATQVAGGCGRI